MSDNEGNEAVDHIQEAIDQMDYERRFWFIGSFE